MEKELSFKCKYPHIFKLDDQVLGEAKRELSIQEAETAKKSF
jgi:hypothetical protein